MEHILVTGAAGFIGFHVSRRLLQDGYRVTGLDNLSPYYSVQLKKDRLAQLQPDPKFQFLEIDLADDEAVGSAFEEGQFDRVINLAAQAGVRHSLTHPRPYVASNVVGFLNVLEGCRNHGVKHLVFASSSSVYGANETIPFSTHHTADHPLSLYAATKKSNELMAHAYAHLYGIPCTGLRFFTVYGPWGRPDMAAFLFAKAILEGRPIDIYNHGDMQRDFTYIDDIVEAVVRILRKPARADANWSGAAPKPNISSAPYRIFNIGGSNPVRLLDFINALEKAVGKKAARNMLPMQPGDVYATWADANDLVAVVDFKPEVPVERGVALFVEWYRSYYNV